MTDHSPTPWKMFDDPLCLVDAQEGSVIGNDGYEMWWADYKTGQAEANAAHIVQCVNSHDILVGALKDISAGWCDVSECMKIAREALTKIEKKP